MSVEDDIVEALAKKPGQTAVELGLSIRLFSWIHIPHVFNALGRLRDVGRIEARVTEHPQSLVNRYVTRYYLKEGSDD